ncbi:MAG: hypothetical protein ACXV2I_13420 [Actinomycetes bacterium]
MRPGTDEPAEGSAVPTPDQPDPSEPGTSAASDAAARRRERLAREAEKARLNMIARHAAARERAAEPVREAWPTDGVQPARDVEPARVERSRKARRARPPKPAARPKPARTARKDRAEQARAERAERARPARAPARRPRAEASRAGEGASGPTGRSSSGALLVGLLAVVVVLAGVVSLSPGRHSPDRGGASGRDAKAASGGGGIYDQAGSRGVAPDSPAVRRLVAWLPDNLPTRASVLVPPALTATLRAALPGRSVVGYSRAGRRSFDVVVVDSLQVIGSGAARMASGALPVAAFGGGSVQVRQPVRADADVQVMDGRARRRVGRALAANRALTLTDAAVRVLRAGEVDPRLLATLSGLAAHHLLTVDLPRDPAAAAGALRRTAWITEVDGVDMARDGRAASPVEQFMSTQPATLAATTLDVQPVTGGVALVLRFALPTPVGVLDAEALPTSSTAPGS